MNIVIDVGFVYFDFTYSCTFGIFAKKKNGKIWLQQMKYFVLGYSCYISLCQRKIWWWFFYDSGACLIDYVMNMHTHKGRVFLSRMVLPLRGRHFLIPLLRGLFGLWFNRLSQGFVKNVKGEIVGKVVIARFMLEK